MRTFKDSADRTWTVAINTATLKRVRDRLGVNLLAIMDSKAALLEQLSTDPILLADVLYVLVEDEAKTRGISDEDFGRALAGDAIDLATTALLEDLVDFFPSARRKVLHEALAKLQTAQARLVDLAAKRVAELDVEAVLATSLLTLGGSSGSSRGSSASIQDP